MNIRDGTAERIEFAAIGALVVISTAENIRFWAVTLWRWIAG